MLLMGFFFAFMMLGSVAYLYTADREGKIYGARCKLEGQWGGSRVSGVQVRGSVGWQ